MQSGEVWGIRPHHQWVRWQSLPPLSVSGRDGVGEYIDLSMVESLAYLDCTALPSLAVDGRPRVFRNGQQNSYTFPMGPFRGSGGYIALQAPGAGPDSPWGRLCGLMGREDMVSDERLIDDDHRLNHVGEVVEAIENWLSVSRRLRKRVGSARVGTHQLRAGALPGADARASLLCRQAHVRAASSTPNWARSRWLIHRSAALPECCSRCAARPT